MEEIDYLFSSKDEGAVKMSLEVRKHGWGNRLDKHFHNSANVNAEKKSGRGATEMIENVAE